MLMGSLSLNPNAKLIVFYNKNRSYLYLWSLKWSIMGIFFKTPKHRVFNYQPLYYDPRKEELEEKIENQRKRDAGEYVPGDNVRKGFRRIQYESKRSSGPSKLIRFVSLVSIVILIYVLMRFTDVFDFFFNM